jgi:acyl-coenzyme A synthetase/AMP-(fatty) acid ligase
LIENPARTEVAVCPRHDHSLGEEVKAVADLKPGQKVPAEGIQEFCCQRLASYKVTAEVDFINNLPRNTMKRVMKSCLRGEKSSVKG